MYLDENGISISKYIKQYESNNTILCLDLTALGLLSNKSKNMNVFTSEMAVLMFKGNFFCVKKFSDELEQN
jgi:hypothetical protein